MKLEMAKESGKSIDVTEFKTLSENSTAMLWLTDQQGETIFSNSKWEKFFGRDIISTEGNNLWSESLHPEDRERCLSIFNNAICSRGSYQMEYRLKRMDGEYRS